MPTLFTVSSLASHWGVSTTFIYSLMHSGDLPAFRLGKLWRVRGKAVEEYECRML